MTVTARWTAKLAIRKTLLKSAAAKLAKAELGLAWARKAKRPTVKARETNVSKLRATVQTRTTQVAYAERVIAHNKPETLAERAYREAVSQIGVMETGGNNEGVPLARYERSNGATGPEPWCGDFQGWCYRMAGCTRVVRAWAAVALLRGLAGITATTNPVRGDLVRFIFDHVGMFSRWLKADAAGQMVDCPEHEATHLETIEGNTGAVGAVSDSTTGGDGVYRKVRERGLVRDFLHVS